MSTRETTQKFLGKPAKDVYGKYSGLVLGASLDGSGQMSFLIDQGNGSLSEYSKSNTVIEGDNLVTVPVLKLEVENFRKDSAQAQRKTQALEELMKNEEIPQYVYEELSKQYKDTINDLQNTSKTLVDKLRKRTDALDSQTRDIERFLTNVKVQHKMSEMNDETFRLTVEHLVAWLDSTSKEKKEIQGVVATLLSPFPSTLQAPPSDVKQEPPKPKDILAPPVIIHLQTPNK